MCLPGKDAEDPRKGEESGGSTRFAAVCRARIEATHRIPCPSLRLSLPSIPSRRTILLRLATPVLSPRPCSPGHQLVLAVLYKLHLFLLLFIIVYLNHTPARTPVVRSISPKVGFGRDWRGRADTVPCLPSCTPSRRASRLWGGCATATSTDFGGAGVRVCRGGVPPPTSVGRIPRTAVRDVGMDFVHRHQRNNHVEAEPLPWRRWRRLGRARSGNGNRGRS